MSAINLKICFSGHRPNKLGGYNYDSKKNLMIREYFLNLLADRFYRLPEGSTVELINGAALGFDTFMGDVSIQLREHFRGKVDIKVVTAIPFRGHHTRWISDEDVDRLFSLIENSDEVVYVDELPDYSWSADHAIAMLNFRNDYMAERAGEAYVLWDGTTGGTKNFITRSARQNGCGVNVVDPKEIFGEMEITQ